MNGFNFKQWFSLSGNLTREEFWLQYVLVFFIINILNILFMEILGIYQFEFIFGLVSYWVLFVGVKKRYNSIEVPTIYRRWWFMVLCMISILLGILLIFVSLFFNDTSLLILGMISFFIPSIALAWFFLLIGFKKSIIVNPITPIEKDLFDEINDI